MSNTDTYASWTNFHHHHRDYIRSSLRVRNGALNEITLDTDGVLIDLTVPFMEFLADGNVAGLDLDFQACSI